MSIESAERLRRWRREHGLSQAATARYLGYTRQAVYLWESGEDIPHEASVMLALEHWDCLFGSTRRLALFRDLDEWLKESGMHIAFDAERVVDPL